MHDPTYSLTQFTEYTPGLLYYPFAVTLEKCVGSCKTLNDLSNKMCVPHETEDVNISGFNMITGISKWAHIMRV